MSEHPGQIPLRIERALLRAEAAARDGIVRSGDLSRQDRETLLVAGCLRPLLRGWYHLTDSWPGSAEPLAGPADLLRRFLPVYLDHRLGSGWCLCPLSSLEFVLEPATVPERTTAITAGGGATSQALAGLGRLVIYPDPQRLPADPDIHRGMRLMRPEQALARLRGEIWTARPQLVRRALSAVRNWRQLTAELAKDGRVTTAGRLCRALEEAGMGATAGEVAAQMRRAGLRLPPSAPRKTRPPVAGTPASSPPAPTWETALSMATVRWQASLQDHLPQDPAARPALVPHLAQAGDLLVQDTWHSLRLSGLDLDQDLVRVLKRRITPPDPEIPWPAEDPAARFDSLPAAEPLPGESDPVVMVSVQGHLAALLRIRGTILRLLQGEDMGQVLRQDLRAWYLALMRPWAQAGLLPVKLLRRPRPTTGRVFPVRHDPPPPPRIASCLEVMAEALANAPTPGVRAALAHLSLLWIQPYERGNGRMARLLQNTLLTAGGQPWRTIRGDRPDLYLAAVETALQAGDASVFAGLRTAD